MKPVKEIYTKNDVINIIDGILEMPDMVIDILQNENSDHSTTELFDIAEANTKFEESTALTHGGLIALKERCRQFTLGYDYTNDALYAKEELAKAGAVYALPDKLRNLQFFSFASIWPWELKFWKPTPEDRIKELGKAAALIIAQIDYELNKK